MSAEQQPDVTFQLHRPLPAGAPGPCGGSGLTELNASAAAAPSPREIPNHSTTSKVAYFKRKYAEEEDLQERLHGYFQKHLILQEDRSCIVKLSLEKLRFLEDPEAYLRRSVLINNLLRKIHHEEEELEVGVEEEEEVKEELGEVSGEKVQHRLLFRDRTRLKVLVMDCCSPSFSLEELQRYHQLMSRCCASAQCLYMCPGLPPDPRVLLYDLDDHG